MTLKERLTSERKKLHTELIEPVVKKICVATENAVKSELSSLNIKIRLEFVSLNKATLSLNYKVYQEIDISKMLGTTIPEKLNALLSELKPHGFEDKTLEFGDSEKKYRYQIGFDIDID